MANIVKILEEQNIPYTFFGKKRNPKTISVSMVKARPCADFVEIPTKLIHPFNNLLCGIDVQQHFGVDNERQFLLFGKRKENGDVEIYDLTYDGKTMNEEEELSKYGNLTEKHRSQQLSKSLLEVAKHAAKEGGKDFVLIAGHTKVGEKDKSSLLNYNFTLSDLENYIDLCKIIRKANKHAKVFKMVVPSNKDCNIISLDSSGQAFIKLGMRVGGKTVASFRGDKVMTTSSEPQNSESSFADLIQEIADIGNGFKNNIITIDVNKPTVRKVKRETSNEETLS